MTLSIALCTYNGASFLQEQLDSIAAQTRLPDEVVVCDDASQDATISIIQAWAAQVPFEVRLYQNERNLGSTKNFERAISLCSGEIIALSDQDDVWYAQKLERLESVFAAAPQVGLVFSDADVVDESLKPLGRSLWDYVSFDLPLRKAIREGRAFEILLSHSLVTGATMAFRANFRQLVLPIPEGIMSIHDGWIALMAAGAADIEFLDEPLLQYRQHAGQQVGVLRQQEAFALGSEDATESKHRHYAAHLRHLSVVHDRFAACGEACGVKDLAARLAAIRRQMAHLEVRNALPVSRMARLPFVLRELVRGNYHRYSNGFRSAVVDVLL